VEGPGDQTAATFSPDGRWIAYSSNESGRQEVFVTPYPRQRNSTREQLSITGGDQPRWSRDGKTVYFTWGGRIQRVTVDPSSGKAGRPQLLPRLDRMVNWSLGADGRLLVGKVPESAANQSVDVVLNSH
jgi:Tol biopolymer transport system component